MKVAYIHTESQKFALCFALEKAFRMADAGGGCMPLVQLSLGVPLQQSLLSLMAEVPWLRKLSQAGEESLSDSHVLLDAILFSDSFDVQPDVQVLFALFPSSDLSHEQLAGFFIDAYESADLQLLVVLDSLSTTAEFDARCLLPPQSLSIVREHRQSRQYEIQRLADHTLVETICIEAGKDDRMRFIPSDSGYLLDF